MPGVFGIDDCRPGLIFSRGPEGTNIPFIIGNDVILRKEVVAGGGLVVVLVVEAGVEESRFLCADGEGFPILDGVEENVIAQEMALDGKQEGLATTLQALEEVGPAKTHQAAAGPGEILERISLGLGGWLASSGGDVIPKPVTGQAECADGINNGV